MAGIFRKEADVQWSWIRLGGLLAVAVTAVTLAHEPSHAEEQIAEVRSLSHELAVLESEEMVYSASKRLEAVNTAPMAVSVMTADRIEAIPSRYLPPVLRLLPR